MRVQPAPARDLDAAAARDVNRREAPAPAPHAVEPASEQELIAHLEPDQFVAETSRPVPRAALSGRALVALWALRVFAVLVSVLVIYTFIDQLH